VVDTGYVRHEAQTVALVRAAFGQSGPQLLINTHLHSDHCGGNAALQNAYPGLRTLIPPGLAGAVEAWNEDALSFAVTGQICPRFGFDGLLQPGQEVRTGELLWQIHAAPGHDPHSVVLFEPASRTLVSADALWENGFGVVFPELDGERAFEELGATLDLIEALAPLTVIPGHGAVFHFSDPVMARARQRLASFTQDPRRHAQHAAKVLLKFKLLEVQQQPLDAFMAWATGMSYMGTVHRRFFPELAFDLWVGQLMQDLVRAGAAEVMDAQVCNR
jgi:glyoxylase-like metal-dependent hydrolase (beta-lactamase superfamily II)